VTEVTDQETFKEVYDDSGTAISITVAQNRIVVLTSTDSLAFAPLRHIKIRSGTASSPVTQQESVIKVIVKE
jgi:hypothetical protein